MEYDKEYFDFQKNIGAFGGVANKFKFIPYYSKSDTILDFGCGGGYLLHNIECKDKAGLEINPVARKEAESHGLRVYGELNDVPNNFASVVISNHALEHVARPLDELRNLLPKIQPGGKAVFVVPHQRPNEAFKQNDVNQHLYTWNPMTLGNLFKAAGYERIEVDVLRFMWPTNYTEVYQKWGPDIFSIICRIRALRKGSYQIRAVARRPAN